MNTQPNKEGTPLSIKLVKDVEIKPNPDCRTSFVLMSGDVPSELALRCSDTDCTLPCVLRGRSGFTSVRELKEIAKSTL